VERRFQDEEAAPMKCHVCGAKMTSQITDLPFKLNEAAIVILKDLPVLQCDGCNEYLLEDRVMERVEEILRQANSRAELEIIRFAA
jgi:YgiT-type zinc finger domain-containing protein